MIAGVISHIASFSFQHLRLRNTPSELPLTIQNFPYLTENVKVNVQGIILDSGKYLNQKWKQNIIDICLKEIEEKILNETEEDLKLLENKEMMKIQET